MLKYFEELFGDDTDEKAASVDLKIYKRTSRSPGCSNIFELAQKYHGIAQSNPDIAQLNPGIAKFNTEWGFDTVCWDPNINAPCYTRISYESSPPYTM